MSTKNSYVLLALCAIAGALFFGYTAYVRHINQEYLAQVFTKASEIQGYVQDVETLTVLSDRTLEVRGLYTNSTKEGAYRAVATTTLSIPDQPALTFNLSNVSIGDTVYVRVTTADPSLFTTIPADGTWRALKANAIPKEFEGVAIPGPVLDNLVLLSKGGKYLAFQDKMGDETLQGEVVGRYRFTLSDEIPSDPSPLKALYDRVGPGTIDLWVGEDLLVRQIVLYNPPYVSTTTIRDINNPPSIAAPM